MEQVVFPITIHTAIRLSRELTHSVEDSMRDIWGLWEGKPSMVWEECHHEVPPDPDQPQLPAANSSTRHANRLHSRRHSRIDRNPVNLLRNLRAVQAAWLPSFTAPVGSQPLQSPHGSSERATRNPMKLLRNDSA